MRIKLFLLIIGLTAAAANAADDQNLPPFTYDFKLEGLPNLKDKKALDAFINNVKTDTLPKLIQMNDCVQRTKIIMESYKSIKELGFGKDRKDKVLVIDAKPELPFDFPYNMNMLDNFNSLQSSQSAAMDKIEAFHKAMKLPEEPTAEDIKTRLSTIDAKVESLMTSVAESSAREDAFLFLISRSSNAVAALTKDGQNDMNFILSDSCKEVAISSVAAYVATDLAQMSDGIHEMKAVVVQIRDRRRKMIDYLFNYHKFKLTTAYYGNSEDSLKDLQDKILSVFATARFVEEMNGWWQAVITKGLADRYHTYYCQYDEALRRLRATREKAQAYLEKIEIYKDAPESMKDAYRQQANAILATIDRNINKLLKGGWQAQFTQQKFMVDYMLGIKDQFVPACVPLLNDYNRYASGVASNDDFHLAERKYAVLIDSCVAKKGQ